MSSTTELVGGALATAGCAVAVLATLAMLRVTTVYDRLHFLAPVTTVAAPLVGAGLIVNDGLTISSVQIALIVVVLATTGPAITSAMARAHSQRTQDGNEEPE